MDIHLPIFLGAIVVVLCAVIYKLWRRLKIIEDEVKEIQDNQRVDGMMIGAYGHESQEGVRTIRQYAQRIHRGLIKASGYVDSDEVEPIEWLYWNYIQRSNRDYDYRRLDAQIHAYYEEESKRQNGRIKLPDGRPMSDDKLTEGEEFATMRLDSGEIVQVLARFLEPREPESENEAEENINVMMPGVGDDEPTPSRTLL